MIPFADSANLNTLTWPASKLSEAVEILARRSNLINRPPELTLPHNSLQEASDAEITGWLDIVTGQMALEVELLETAYVQVAEMLRQAGPAVLRIPQPIPSMQQQEPQFLLLLKGGHRWMSIITPEHKTRWVRSKAVHRALCQAIEAPWQSMVSDLLNDAAVPLFRRGKVHQAILREQLSGQRISGCWLLRLSPQVDFWRQLKQANLPWYSGGLITVHLIEQLLTVCAWWLIGRSVLSGYFEWAWLWAWALILLTTIPLQTLRIWLRSLLTLTIGRLFRQRLIYGTLRLQPDEIRHEGAGQFLGRVMETEAIEMLALGGGFAAMLAAIELGLAVAVLAVGAGGGLHALSLIGWMVLTLLIGWRYLRRNQHWVAAYRQMTNDLVERMIGHRTRLAQENREQWHQEEDQILARYLELSTQLDQVGMQLSAIIPRGWLISGVVGVAYAFVMEYASPAMLAISLGGIILGERALKSLISGFASIVSFAVAWEQVGPLFRAATRPTAEQNPALIAPPPPQTKPGLTVLELRDLTFQYNRHVRAVLQQCRLKIKQGDHLLLEGPSGGGKSTLAALLVGLKQPDAGLMLLHGFDQQTIGLTTWRQRVIAAPQFHENHVLTETFAFNLLMGRNWPPSSADLAEAEAVCRELGLGELLDRMPAGLQQMIGESGWQLSHGERSRLFIARALLQQADLIVLDESFAALDPENLRQALTCVLNRAPTLLVIAHP